MAEDSTPFLSRWARRKAAAREAQPLLEPDRPLPPAEIGPSPEPVEALPPAQAEAAAPPPPTLDEAEQLTPASDFTRFVGRGVQPEVKNAALKKLFADPHFNVMDGLDTYIDDYGKADPLPAHWLRQMVQSKALGLFTEPPPPEAERHEDPDLQLQPDDDAGRTGAAPGPGEDTGRPD